MDSPGQNTGVGAFPFSREIFPIQGLNPGLLHCRRILYQLSHQGSPVVQSINLFTNTNSLSWTQQILCELSSQNHHKALFLPFAVLLWTFSNIMQRIWKNCMLNARSLTIEILQLASVVPSLSRVHAQSVPVDCTPRGSSVHGIPQARTLEWVAVPSTRGSSWPRNQTRSSCIAGDSVIEPLVSPSLSRICPYLCSPVSPSLWNTLGHELQAPLCFEGSLFIPHFTVEGSETQKSQAVCLDDRAFTQ